MGDYNNLGNDLKNKINDAVNSKNFDKLSGDISNIIDNAFNGVRSGIASTGNTIKNAFFKNKNSAYTPYPTNRYALPSGYGMVALICGIVGGVFLSAVTVILFLICLLMGGSAGIFIAFLCSLACSVACFIAASRGSFAKNLKRKFDRYCSIMIGKSCYEIDYVSVQMMQPRKQTLKELSKLIRLGAFPQGHIDTKKKYFIGDDSTYNHFLASLELTNQRLKEIDSEKLEEIRGDIEKGREHIKLIRQANVLILNEEMSAKLNDTELILKRIFDRVEQKPDLLPEIRKLIEYYLPITQKLIDAYIDLDKQSAEFENIEKSKTEIEKSMDCINTAFFNLYNSLFHDDKVDIISDISVLRSMFAQEGLNNTDFNDTKG